MDRPQSPRHGLLAAAVLLGLLLAAPLAAAALQLDPKTQPSAPAPEAPIAATSPQSAHAAPLPQPALAAPLPHPGGVLPGPMAPPPPVMAAAAPAPAGKPPNGVACSADKLKRDPGCLWCVSGNTNQCIACRGGAYWTSPIDNSCGCAPGFGSFVSSAVVRPPVTFPRGGCVVASANLNERCMCRACPGGTFSEGGSLTTSMCTM
jgi:hypothetical protein